jgi:hypothetical protein
MFLLDNSGSTAEEDGTLLRTTRVAAGSDGAIFELHPSSRWMEIQQVARDQVSVTPSCCVLDHRRSCARLQLVARHILCEVIARLEAGIFLLAMCFLADCC